MNMRRLNDVYRRKNSLSKLKEVEEEEGEQNNNNYYNTNTTSTQEQHDNIFLNEVEEKYKDKILNLQCNIINTSSSLQERFPQTNELK